MNYKKLLFCVGMVVVSIFFLHTSTVFAALAQTELTTSGVASGGPFTTASITPTANNLILAFVELHNGSPITATTTATLSGNSLTWVQIATSSLFNTFTAAGSSKLLVFRAMGVSPTSGAVTITPLGTVTGGAWSIVQWSGVTTMGTDGSAAVVQVVSATGTAVSSAALSMSPFAFSDNGVSTMWAMHAVAAQTDNITPSNGHTGNTQFNVLSPTAQNGGYRSAYLTTSDTAPAATFAVTAQGWVGMAVEVTAHDPGTVNSGRFRIFAGKFRSFGGMLRIR